MSAFWPDIPFHGKIPTPGIKNPESRGFYINTGDFVKIPGIKVWNWEKSRIPGIKIPKSGDIPRNLIPIPGTSGFFVIVSGFSNLDHDSRHSEIFRNLHSGFFSTFSYPNPGPGILEFSRFCPRDRNLGSRKKIHHDF